MRRGYFSSKPVESLRPPPKGPAPGAKPVPLRPDPSLTERSPKRSEPVKVYVVQDYAGDGSAYLRGVFSSKERAEAKQAESEAERPHPNAWYVEIVELTLDE